MRKRLITLIAAMLLIVAAQAQPLTATSSYPSSRSRDRRRRA